MLEISIPTEMCCPINISLLPLCTQSAMALGRLDTARRNVKDTARDVHNEIKKSIQVIRRANKPRHDADRERSQVASDLKVELESSAEYRAAVENIEK